MSECITTKTITTDVGGYKIANVMGRRVRAHRLVAHLFHGLDLHDTKSYVLHSCDNPACINPEHLRIGSARENMQDCIKRGRHRPPKSNGEANGMAKLTKSMVDDIRAMYSKEKKVTYEDIAVLYDISVSSVSLIINRKTWKYG